VTDDTTATAPEHDAQAGTTQSESAQSQTQAQPVALVGPDGQPLDQARYDKFIRDFKRLRDLEDTYKKSAPELEGLRKEKAEREQADMTEVDRLKAQLAEAEKREADAKAREAALQQQHRETQTRHALEDAARAAGMGKAAAIWKLADLDALEYEEGGPPKDKSIEKVVARVKEEYPELFGEAAGQSKPGNGKDPRPASASQTDAEARREQARLYSTF